MSEKDKFLKALRDEGFIAEYRDNVPTVLINPTENMEEVIERVHKVQEENNYQQSFGVAVSKEVAIEAPEPIEVEEIKESVEDVA
jgi:hypothetical protein